MNIQLFAYAAVLLGNKAEEFETADLRDKPSVLSAAPNLSQLLTARESVYNLHAC